MQRMMRPIPVLFWSEDDGTMHPLRFTPHAKAKEMRIRNVVKRFTDDTAGQRMQCFLCQDQEKLFEIRYDTIKHRWYLTKW